MKIQSGNYIENLFGFSLVLLILAVVSGFPLSSTTLVRSTPPSGLNLENARVQLKVYSEVSRKANIEMNYV